MKVEPIKKLSLSRTDKVLERTAIILLALSTISSIVSYFFLPAEIPIHFTGSNSDSYGNRAFIFLPVALSAFFYLLLSTISRFGLARQENNTQNSVREDLNYYRVSVRTMRILKLAIIISFTIDLGESIRIAVIDQKYLSSVVFISEGILVGIPAILVTTLLVRKLPEAFTKN
jgi:hypothetical protein